MLHTDGASRGNPGPAAIGVVIRTPDGRLVAEVSEAIGVATNNVAEYTALVRGLERARALGARRVRVRADSELLVRQLAGTYAVRNEGLRPLFEEARRLLASFEAAEVRHVPREENREADRLANAALERPEAGAAAPAAGVGRPVRRQRVLLVDAFTCEPFHGNPAGVVPDADGLAEAAMQRIARELGASETCFLLAPARGGDLRLRYFTPAREVPLCGHATVAAVHVLAAEGRLRPAAAAGEGVEVAAARLETGAGLLPVEARWEGGRVTALLGQPAPRFRPFGGDAAEVAACLGLPPAAIAAAGLPVALASTGLWHLLVPVAGLEAVRRAAPDLTRLARLNEALGVHTTHVYALEALDPAADLHARSFAPAIGVAEDPQTGTASGALAAFLAALGLLVPAGGLGQPSPARPGAVRLVMEQGHELGRPGRIEVEVVAGEGLPPAAASTAPAPPAPPTTKSAAGLPPLRPVSAVWVGGEAVTVLDGHLLLPI